MRCTWSSRGAPTVTSRSVTTPIFADVEFFHSLNVRSGRWRTSSLSAHSHRLSGTPVKISMAARITPSFVGRYNTPSPGELISSVAYGHDAERGYSRIYARDPDQFDRFAHGIIFCEWIGSRSRPRRSIATLNWPSSLMTARTRLYSRVAASWGAGSTRKPSSGSTYIPHTGADGRDEPEVSRLLFSRHASF